VLVKIKCFDFSFILNLQLAALFSNTSDSGFKSWFRDRLDTRTSRVYLQLLQLSTAISQYSNTGHSLPQPLQFNVYKQADQSALHVYAIKKAQVCERGASHLAGNLTSGKLKIAVCVNIVMLQREN
jgi:hypothetical protein